MQVLANDWYTRELQLDALAEELDGEEVRALAYEYIQRLETKIIHLTQKNAFLNGTIVSLRQERGTKCSV